MVGQRAQAGDVPPAAGRLLAYIRRTFMNPQPMNRSRLNPSRPLALVFATLAAVVLVAGCAGTQTDTGWPEKVIAFEKLRPQTPFRASIPVTSITEATPGGRAVLQVHVDEQGLVRRVLVVESSGSARQDGAAIDALKRTRFAPYAENGVAMPVTAVVPMQFPAMTGRKPLATFGPPS